MRTLIASFILMLTATAAGATGTKVQLQLIPQEQVCTPNYPCDSGACSTIGGACTVDSDCTSCSITRERCSANADCFSVLSPKSKFQMLGTGLLKVSVKGLTGAGGVPVTTDGVTGTADDYIVVLQLTNGGISEPYTLKLDLDKGKGSVTADLASLLPSAGTTIGPVPSILSPPANPADCPGDNSTTAVQARETGLSDCRSGAAIALGNLVRGDATTKLKVSMAPVLQTCATANACTSGFCSFGASCTTNSDCYRCSFNNSEPCATDGQCRAGAPSLKSKVQLNGALRLKVNLSGVLDASGLPLTTDGVAGTADDYVLAVFYETFDGLAGGTILKVDFKNGKAALNLDLSGVVDPATTAVPFRTIIVLTTPPAVPADCHGTNSTADILARGFDAACTTGFLRGFGGIIVGQ